MTEVTNALSFDVEDYFQVSAFEGSVRREDWVKFESRVAANTRLILEILDRGGARATFFVLGWVAEHHPDVVREIAGRGHEVASHGYSHRLVYGMTPEEFRDDVRRSKDLLEGIAGRPVLGYRAPSFSIVARSLWGLQVLVDLGFRYDSSIFPVRHDRYGIPSHPRFPHRMVTEGGGRSGEIVEFPMTTARWGGLQLPVAGGGYLRLLSYRYIRWGLRRVNGEGQPAVFYLHPWELDPGQPRLPCGWKTRIRHYASLGRTAGSLKRLLGDFRFAPMADVLRERGLLGREGA